MVVVGVGERIVCNRESRKICGFSEREREREKVWVRVRNVNELFEESFNSEKALQ